MDAKDLAARRLMVLTRSINPDNVSIALEGLTMATVAILATLRVRFAKAITLGTAIGDVLNKIFSPFSTQLLEYGLPRDYEKWIPVRCPYPILITYAQLPIEVHNSDCLTLSWRISHRSSTNTVSDTPE